MRSYWTRTWQGQRTPGLAWISYAEGLKCAPPSYTTQRTAEPWQDSLYTQAFKHIYRELQKGFQNTLPEPASPTRCGQVMKYPKMRWQTNKCFLKSNLRLLFICWVILVLSLGRCDYKREDESEGRVEEGM